MLAEPAGVLVRVAVGFDLSARPFSGSRLEIPTCPWSGTSWRTPALALALAVVAIVAMYVAQDRRWPWGAGGGATWFQQV
jgi:hypothetical protein